MEKIDKLLKRYLKRKVKMTTAVLVAFLISGSLSFASGGASATDVLDDQLHDLYLAPGEYTPDDDGNINMSLVNRQDGNKEDMPDESIYNMSEEDFNKLSDHDKELLKNRRVTIKNVVNKDKMIGDVTSNTLTITNGTDRLYGADDLTVELKDDSVDTNHLKENAVTEEKIKDGAVTEGKLGTDSVTEEKIKDGAVTEGKLGTDSVTEGKIKDGAVTENKLANDAVTEGKIKDGAVTENKLANDSVTEGKIKDGAVSKNKLSEPLKEEIDGKVNKTEMTGDVTSNTLTITNGENRLFGDSTLTVELKNDTVDTAHLKDNAVTEGKIKDGAVTENKLANDAVTEGKIKDGAVTENKLANDAVTEGKIKDGAVSRDKLSNALKTEIDGKVNKADLTGDITSTTITVTGGDNKLLGDVKLEIADGAVTKEKLSNSLKTKIAEIDNKANIDATNIDTDKYISKLNEGVNIDTPAGKLVKDSDLKKHLDENYYNKSQIDTMVNRTDSALSGVANAVAMANLPQVSSYNDYRHMVSAAYGNYEGQSAISVGLSGISQNNRVTYKVSGSLNTKGKLALGAGIGVMIGKVKTPTIEMPTSIKDKLEKSEKERQEMQVKLSEQKEMVNKQAEQIKDLYEIIKGLKEELKKR